MKKLDKGFQIPAEGKLLRVRETIYFRTPNGFGKGVMVLTGDDELIQSRPLQLSRSMQLNQEVYETLRIEAGVPKIDHEITDRTIPLEVGMEDLIDTSKGCYIGQEVIARMQARGQMSRKMFGLHLSGEAVKGTPLAQSGKEVGVITSVVLSPRFGWIALAMVRLSVFNSKLGISLRGLDGHTTIAELPFRDNASPLKLLRP